MTIPYVLEQSSSCHRAAARTKHWCVWKLCWRGWCHSALLLLVCLVFIFNSSVLLAHFKYCLYYQLFCSKMLIDAPFQRCTMMCTSYCIEFSLVITTHTVWFCKCTDFSQHYDCSNDPSRVFIHCCRVQTDFWTLILNISTGFHSSSVSICQKGMWCKYNPTAWPFLPANACKLWQADVYLAF